MRAKKKKKYGIGNQFFLNNLPTDVEGKALIIILF